MVPLRSAPRLGLGLGPNEQSPSDLILGGSVVSLGGVSSRAIATIRTSVTDLGPAEYVACLVVGV